MNPNKSPHLINYSYYYLNLILLNLLIFIILIHFILLNYLHHIFIIIIFFLTAKMKLNFINNFPICIINFSILIAFIIIASKNFTIIILKS